MIAPGLDGGLEVSANLDDARRVCHRPRPLPGIAGPCRWIRAAVRSRPGSWNTLGQRRTGTISGDREPSAESASDRRQCRMREAGRSSWKARLIDRWCASPDPFVVRRRDADPGQPAVRHAASGAPSRNRASRHRLVILGFASLWGFPVISSVVGGDLFASEDRYGTWKTVLARARSRAEFFAGQDGRRDRLRLARTRGARLEQHRRRRVRPRSRSADRLVRRAATGA